MRKENAWNVQEGKWYPLREKPSCSAAGGDNATEIINAINNGVSKSKGNNNNNNYRLS